MGIDINHKLHFIDASGNEHYAAGLDRPVAFGSGAFSAFEIQTADGVRYFPLQSDLIPALSSLVATFLPLYHYGIHMGVYSSIPLVALRCSIYMQFHVSSMWQMNLLTTTITYYQAGQSDAYYYRMGFTHGCRINMRMYQLFNPYNDSNNYVIVGDSGYTANNPMLYIYDYDAIHGPTILELSIDIFTNEDWRLHPGDPDPTAVHFSLGNYTLSDTGTWDIPRIDLEEELSA